jgi:hypothetical protein
MQFYDVKYKLQSRQSFLSRWLRAHSRRALRGSQCYPDDIVGLTSAWLGLIVHPSQTALKVSHPGREFQY